MTYIIGRERCRPKDLLGENTCTSEKKKDFLFTRFKKLSYLCILLYFVLWNSNC